MVGGQPYTRSGDMWRVVAILAAGLVLVIVFAAVLFKDSELLNPSLHAAETDRLRAEADKLRAEAEALRAQTADEQRQRELERRLAEAKAAVEEQALRDRRAVQSELLRLGGTLGLVTVSIAMLALVFTFSYRLMMNANISPKTPEPARKLPTNIIPIAY